MQNRTRLTDTDNELVTKGKVGWGIHWNSGLTDQSVSLIAQLCPTLCNPTDCSTPGCPVLHYLLEFTQTHVRRVGDAIQPSHPLSSPYPPAFNLSQHQRLFQWVSSSHQVTKVLESQASIYKINNNKNYWIAQGTIFNILK